MSGKGTPRRPLVVGGACHVGRELIVLLANTHECEEIRVLDIVKPDTAVVENGGVLKDKMTFTNHRLGTDPIDQLDSVLDQVDCVFMSITPHVQNAPEKDFYSTNQEGVRLLVDACVKKDLPRIVFLSSIAVTNHFIPSENWTEDKGLPAKELYESPYDITKRAGEEAVLAANGTGKLKTCALRPGGIMTSVDDFIFTNMFMLPGFVPKPSGVAVVDFIDGRDVCRGMLLAAKALETSSEGVAGEAFFLSKGEGLNTGTLAEMTARRLGWQCIPVPKFVILLTIGSLRVVHKLKNALGFQVPGIPPHKFVQLAFFQQTFDNTKAKIKLGYEAKVSSVQAVNDVCTRYEEVYAHRPRICKLLIATAGVLALVSVFRGIF